MSSLAEWLEAHKDQLVSRSLQELSAQERLRQEASGPVKWFFDSLIEVIRAEKPERLEALLRNWVTMCSIPINGQPVGLLPVLGGFKRATWQVFLGDPPPETPLVLAVQLDTTISQAAEFLSKIEAAALLDAMTHQLAARPGQGSDQLDNMKETFVSVAAHELKTPLTVIEGYAHMLKGDLPEAAYPREALMIRGIESGVVRLRELVEDLIDVSLIEIDLLRLELQPVWLPRLLDLIEAELSEAVKARKLTLTVKKETIPTKPIGGDPERLFKAFQKVVANAIKYTPDGGRITIHGRALNGFVEIVIEDTGIGIPIENLDSIFEKFSSASNPALHSSGKVKFKGGGAGLGLVIARGILEAHGGSIWAESSGADEEKLPGSRFHLMIPARDVASGEGMSPVVARAASMLASRPVPAETVSAPASEESISAGETPTPPVTVAAGEAAQDKKESKQEPVQDQGRTIS